MSNCHQVNEDTLSHELIDGEVVVIQFDTGNYYSLAGAAADLWQRLLSPATTADLLALFTDAPAEAAADIEAFVNELLAEGLLRPAQPAAAPSPAAPLGYAKPELNKYTDMQQLLLADPLHEVEEAGWPHTKPAAD